MIEVLCFIHLVVLQSCLEVKNNYDKMNERFTYYKASGYDFEHIISIIHI